MTLLLFEQAEPNHCLELVISIKALISAKVLIPHRTLVNEEIFAKLSIIFVFGLLSLSLRKSD